MVSPELAPPLPVIEILDPEAPITEPDVTTLNPMLLPPLLALPVPVIVIFPVPVVWTPLADRMSTPWLFAPDPDTPEPKVMQRMSYLL